MSMKAVWVWIYEGKSLYGLAENMKERCGMKGMGMEMDEEEEVEKF